MRCATARGSDTAGKTYQHIRNEKEKERKRKQGEKESDRIARRREYLSIWRSAADTALNFRKLIKLAHVRYVRRTNKGDVETSSYSRAFTPSLSLRSRSSPLGGTPFRSGERENNGSNLGRSQCTTCWCFLADKARLPPVHLSSSVQARERSATRWPLATKVYSSAHQWKRDRIAMTKGETARERVSCRARRYFGNERPVI